MYRFYNKNKTFIYIFLHLLSYTSIYGQQNLEPLIGVYYFGGWSGNNKTRNEAWASNAPTHLTKELATTYKNRQPIWGWRDDTPQIMEQQIKLASKNGIDFFSFCWYWKNDNSSIDTTKINQHSCHTCIKLFQKAKNKKHLKFSLLIANHKGARINTKKDWLNAIDYWVKHYFKDEQYLKINNRPVISIFTDNERINHFLPDLNNYIKKYNFDGLFIISNGYYDKNSHYNMVSRYNIREPEPGHSLKKEYSDFLHYIENQWMNIPNNVNFAPCVMTNWDRRPWEVQNQHGIYYVNRTPQLFKIQLTKAMNLIYDRHEQYPIIFIYAWNELGEGGYLVPTQEDKRNRYLKTIKQVKKQISENRQ